MVPKEHTSLNGETKSHLNLIHFTELAQENIIQDIKNLKNGKTDTKLEFVHVAERKFQEIENMTKADIKVKIFEIIETMELDQQKLQEERYKKNVLNKNKDEDISFYYEMYEILEEKDCNKDTEGSELP